MKSVHYIKPDKYTTKCLQFRTIFPPCLFGVMEPKEFEVTIERFNKLLETTQKPKALFALIPLFFIGGFILVFGVFYATPPAMVFGIILALLSFIAGIVATVYYKSKSHKQLSFAVEEANNYYNKRGITFSTYEKFSKHHKVDLQGQPRYKKWTYIKIEYTLPAQQVNALRQSYHYSQHNQHHLGLPTFTPYQFPPPQQEPQQQQQQLNQEEQFQIIPVSHQQYMEQYMPNQNSQSQPGQPGISSKNFPPQDVEFEEPEPTEYQSLLNAKRAEIDDDF